MNAVTKGRPKSERKKQQIYDAATHLFLDHGYDGVSMDKVAELAGVSKQTVYSHFASKDKLFSACVEQKCVAYELGEAYFDPASPTRDTLLAIGSKFSELLLSREAIRVKQILCAQTEGSVLSQLFYDAGPANMQRSFAHYLDSQVKRGHLAIDDTLMAARQFLFMLHGDAHIKALLNVPGRVSQAERNRYVQSCVEVFLRAYQAD